MSEDDTNISQNVKSGNNAQINQAARDIHINHNVNNNVASTIVRPTNRQILEYDKNTRRIVDSARIIRKCEAPPPPPCNGDFVLTGYRYIVSIIFRIFVFSVVIFHFIPKIFNFILGAFGM